MYTAYTHTLHTHVGALLAEHRGPYQGKDEKLLQVADPMLAEGAAYPIGPCSSWQPDPATFFQDGAELELDELEREWTVMSGAPPLSPSVLSRLHSTLWKCMLTCTIPMTHNTTGARIEAAFRKYFHRNTDGYRAWRKEKEKQDLADDGTILKDGEPKSYAGEDTYELVVCHGNVIRYCLLRALQM